jgi:hypothetical protein
MKRTKNNAMPPGMRCRVHGSGLPHFYWELPASGRREIPLGSDYKTALLLRCQYLLKFDPMKLDQIANSDLVLNLYLEAVVPNKAKSIREENCQSIERLRKFFSEEKVNWSLQVHVERRDAYFRWRGPKATIRARHEWSLMGAVNRWFTKAPAIYLSINERQCKLGNGNLNHQC